MTRAHGDFDLEASNVQSHPSEDRSHEGVEPPRLLSDDAWRERLREQLSRAGGCVSVVLISPALVVGEAPADLHALVLDRVRRALTFRLRQTPQSSELWALPDGRLAWILGGAGRAEALETIETVRRDVAGAEIVVDAARSMSLTFSAAVGEFPRDASNANELIELLERTVERAENTGHRSLEIPPCVLLAGDAPNVLGPLALLRTREDLRLVSSSGGFADSIRLYCPAVVVADALAPRRVHTELAKAVAASPNPPRVILATPRGPDPRYLAASERIPASVVVMGPSLFTARLAEAVATALGVKPRRDLRARLQVPVRVSFEERHSVGRSILLDVSQSGARFALDELVTVGDPLRVQFSWRGEDLDLLAQVARVLPSEGSGTEVGVRFLGPTDRQVATLRSIVADEHGEAPGRTAPSTQVAPVVQPSAGPAFELKGVERSFGSMAALFGVNLKLARGERLAIIGPSGAGKSTLLKLLNTSLLPTSGELRILGEEPARQRPGELQRLRSRIGTVYQQLHLVPQATVFQNVVSGRLGRRGVLKSLLSLLSADEADQVAMVLDEVGLSSKIYSRVDRLSGGEQQRVAIARAIYQQPDVLIADEPLASIDPTSSSEVIDLLLRASRGRTLILTTHQLEPVLPYFPRVLGVRRGRVLFDKRKEDVTLEDLAALYESERAARPETPVRTLSDPGLPLPRQGTVAVGASAAPGEFILPTIIPRFVRENPGIRVSMGVKGSREVVEDLLAGRIDLGFVGGTVPHPDLVFEPFAEDEIICVAAQAFRGLPEGVVPCSLATRLPRIEREDGSATRAVVEDHFANMGVTLDASAITAQVGSLSGLKAVVQGGLGVAFVSRLTVERELAAGLVREVKIQNVKIPRRIFVVRRRGGDVSPAARRFLELARQQWATRVDKEGVV